MPQDFIGVLLNNIFIYGDIGVKVARLTVAQLAKGQYLHIAPRGCGVKVACEASILLVRVRISSSVPYVPLAEKFMQRPAKAFSGERYLDGTPNSPLTIISQCVILFQESDRKDKYAGIL